MHLHIKMTLKTAQRTNNAKMEAYRSEVVSWCQSSKARALTYVLGFEADTQAGMMASINESSVAVQSLAKEKAILHEMDGVSLSQKVQLRENLKELQDRMRMDELKLRPVMDMRAGNSLSAQEFGELAEIIRKDVVIVDWVVVFGLSIEVIMVIYREGRLCNMTPLQLIPKKAIVPKKNSHAPETTDQKAAEEEQSKDEPKLPPPQPQ